MIVKKGLFFCKNTRCDPDHIRFQQNSLNYKYNMLNQELLTPDKGKPVARRGRKTDGGYIPGRVTEGEYDTTQIPRLHFYPLGGILPLWLQYYLV